MRAASPRDLEGLDATRLGATLERIAGIGNRFPGTAGEALCRELLLDELTELGLARVRAEEFPYLAYEPVAASCEVVGEGWRLEAVALQCTASAAVEGEAVYLGACRPEDVAAIEARGVDLAGRVVVAHASMAWLVAPQLVAKGIAALVNVSDAPDGLIGHFPASLYPPPLEPPWAGRILPFPGVSVEAQAGRRLISLLTAGPVRLRVEHRARDIEKISANVIAEIPGEDEPGQRVVLGAHYDTQLAGPGAADNATGLAALLELARVLRGLRLRRTVVLCAFGVEELGFFGSYHYVLRDLAANAATVGMVNLDALGLPSPGRRLLVADPSIAAFAAESATQAGWEPEETIDGSLNAWADHNPFIDAGIPACWLWRYPPQHPYYHCAGDTLHWVDLARVHDIALASGFVALRLATVPEPGIGRARPSRVFATIPRVAPAPAPR